ncbi:hypothetical protein RFI_07342, partial [Reticulomyxa filosa]
KSKMGFMICRGLEHLPFSDIKSNNVLLDMVAAENMPVMPNTTIIDVWWLLDDGGLSLLVPHILSIDQFWKRLSETNRKESTVKQKKKSMASTVAERMRAAFVDVDSELQTKENDRQMIRNKQRYIVRLFLVADDNIGGSTVQSDEHASLSVPTSSQSTIDISPGNSLRTAQLSKRLWQAELASLLRKFRLSINGPYPIKSSRREPTLETLQAFCKLTGYNLADSHSWSNTKLKRWLRVSELINAYSHQQKCVFVTAPHPKSFKDPTMYMGVLDMLSRTNDTRATVLLRGTGENVLTFYWE